MEAMINPIIKSLSNSLSFKNLFLLKEKIDIPQKSSKPIKAIMKKNILFIFMINPIINSKFEFKFELLKKKIKDGIEKIKFDRIQ